MVKKLKKSAITCAVSTVAAILLAGCSVKPQPLDEQTVADAAMADRELIYQSQEALDHPLTLSEAMARAVKYNLENRMQLMAEAMAESSFELVKLDMLPILAANAGYFDRSNVDASRSFNIITRQDNFSFSTAQDLQYNTADLNFSFNLLDFGVSYLTAKQEGDRFLVSNLGRRKVVLRLLEQTRGAYWRAVAMQSINDDLDRILASARQSLEQLKTVRENQLASPQIVLQDIRAMLELVQQMEDMKQTVNLAMIELNTLINEPPGTTLQLASIDELPPLPTLPEDLESLELTALTNSSDYVGELYNLRIDQLESRKALIRLLPGLEFSYGSNYTSNSYTYNDNWGLAGIRLTGNLTRFLAYSALSAQGDARIQLALARRLTMNMAVLTGVHLAWQQYANNIDKFGRAQQLEEVDIELSDLAEQSLVNNATSGVSRIQSQARALRSTLAKLMTYADLQSSYGSFLTSLSLDPVPEQYQLLQVNELAPMLASSYSTWERGDYPGLDRGRALLAKEQDAASDNTVMAVATVATSPAAPVSGASSAVSAVSTETQAPVTIIDSGDSVIDQLSNTTAAQTVAEPAQAPAEPVQPPPQVTSAVPAEPATAAPQSRPATPEPVATTSTANALSAAQQAQVDAALEIWENSWEAQNFANYAAVYDPDFEPAGGASVEEWRREREQALLKPESISLDISSIEHELVNEEVVRVRFWLHYETSSYSDDTRKELLLKKLGDSWKIMSEKNREVIYR